MLISVAYLTNLCTMFACSVAIRVKLLYTSSTSKLTALWFTNLS